MATNSHNNTHNDLPAKVTACVTGASGFIGSAVAIRFLDLGHSVRLPLRTEEQARAWRETYGERYKGRIETVLLVKKMDEEGVFEEAVKGCDVVVHAASPVTFTIERGAEEDILKPAIAGTLSLLNTAKKTKTVKMVVYTSSLSAYTSIRVLQTTGEEVRLDDDSWNPFTYEEAAKMTDQDGEEIYSASKALAERTAWEFMKDPAVGFKLCTFGPSAVLGYNPSPLVKTLKDARSSFALVAGWLWDKKQFPPHDGKLYRPEFYVSIKSVVDAHVSAALNPAAGGGKRYALSSDRSSIELLVRAMIKAEPALASHFPPVSQEVTKEEQPRGRYRVDASRAERDLGFKYEPFKDYAAAFAEQVYALAKAGGLA
ncbi:hypothetical protein JCM6882_001779 [Rhodosporidiobolus microsporus]